MADLTVQNLPTGGVTLDITEGAENASEALTIGTKTVPAHDARVRLHRTVQRERQTEFSFNVNVTNHQLGTGLGFEPPEYRFMLPAQPGSGGNVIIGTAEMNFGTSEPTPALRSGALNGATVTVLDITQSPGVVRRTSTVTKHYANADFGTRYGQSYAQYYLTGTTAYMNPSYYGNGPGATSRTGSNGAPAYNVTHYVAVSSINAAGEWSAYSNWVSVTPQSLTKGETDNGVQMSTEQRGNRWVIDPTLNPPINVTAVPGETGIGGIRVDWDPPADATGVIGYVVHVTRASDPANITQDLSSTTGDWGTAILPPPNFGEHNTFVYVGSPTYTAPKPSDGAEAPNEFWVMCIGPDGRRGPSSAAVSITPTQDGGGENTLLGILPPSKSVNSSTVNPALPTVTNVAVTLVDGKAVVTWGEPADTSGIIGYHVGRTYGTAAECDIGNHWLELADDGGPAVQPDDQILIAKTFLDNSYDLIKNDRLFENRSIFQKLLEIRQLGSTTHSPGGVAQEAVPFTFEAHPSRADSPAKKRHFIRFSPTDTSVRSWRMVENGLAFRQVRQVGVWARGTGQLRLEVGALGSTPGIVLGGTHATNTWLDLTSEWVFYSFTVELPGASAATGFLDFQIRGPGDVDLDHYRFFQVDRGWMSLDQVCLEAAQDFGSCAWRLHAMIKTGTGNEFPWLQSAYSLHQLLNNDYARPSGGLHGNATLPEMLRAVHAGGGFPWIQPEIHLQPEEVDGLFEYLCVPYDDQVDTPESKPWAWIRHIQGDPLWIDVFPKMIVEPGNEVWNRDFFKPFAFGLTADRGVWYGCLSEMWFQRWKTHSGWTSAIEAKMRFGLGGWLASSFTERAALLAPSAHFIGSSVYTGGHDGGSGVGIPHPYPATHVLTSAGTFGSTYARRTLAPALRNYAQAAGMQAACYEMNAGAVIPSPDNADKREAERTFIVSKVMAVGSVHAAMVAMFDFGWDEYSLFLADNGADTFDSHQWYGSELLPLPITNYMKLLNQHALRRTLYSSINYTIPRRDIYADIDAPSVVTVANAPTFSAWGFRGDTDFTLVCANVTPDYERIRSEEPSYIGLPADVADTGHVRALIDLPIHSASSLTLHRLTGRWYDNNRSAYNVAPEAISLTPPADCRRILTDDSIGLDAAGVAPTDIIILHFEGVDVP